MRKQDGNILSKILYTFFVIILIVILFSIYEIYDENNFNGLSKSEFNIYSSNFSRDKSVKYNNTSSYKIESTTFNDAMLSKKIQVKKNTPYKVSCMVKVENVETENNPSCAGAHICIADTLERSETISGTADWKKLEFYFNSKNRNEVEVGFRLGGYDDKCTGKVWFSDFMLEEGMATNDTNWKFALFIIENVDVNVNSKNVNISMTETDVSDMKTNMGRFKTSISELSNNKISIDYDVIRISEPLTSLTYDNTNGYYVSPKDAKQLISSHLKGAEYDHIFVAVRLGDEIHNDDIAVYDWIGLGGMDYYGIGFSNIRLPNSSRSYMYKYDPRVNLFPEEVFLHEFLHSLERTLEEYGYDRPELHSYSEYGYSEEKLVGLKKWYQDYMNCTINGKLGLNQAVYTMKPTKASQFTYTVKLDEFEENNLFDNISEIFTNVAGLFEM